MIEQPDLRLQKLTQDFHLKSQLMVQRCLINNKSTDENVLRSIRIKITVTCRNCLLHSQCNTLWKSKSRLVRISENIIDNGYYLLQVLAAGSPSVAAF